MKTFDMNKVKNPVLSNDDRPFGWYDTWEEYAWAVELEKEDKFRNSENMRENILDNRKS